MLLVLLLSISKFEKGTIGSENLTLITPNSLTSEILILKSSFVGFGSPRIKEAKSYTILGWTIKEKEYSDSLVPSG